MACQFLPWGLRIFYLQLPPPGFCTPGPGGGAPRAPAPRGRSPGAPAWAVVEPGGWGHPPIVEALFLKPPSPAVDRLLMKWSLASSAPNRVEVSMMRKFCDTGVRKRLADTGGRGAGRRFKGTVGPPSPFFFLLRNSGVWKGE